MKKPDFLYEFIKSKSNKPKGTILILPAFAANFGPYHKIVEQLTDYDIYQLFTPGGLEINCKPVYEEMNEMLRFEYIADYAVNFIKAKKLKDVIIMGQCVATGPIALIENKCLELISKVVLIAPYCRSYDIAKKLLRKYLPVNNIKQITESGPVIFKKPKEFKGSAYLARCEEMVKKSLALQTQLVFFMDQEILTKQGYDKITKAYSKLKAPTLICVSKYDPVLPFNEGYEELKSLVPHAKIEVFDDSKHMLFEEEHEKFTKVLKEFIEH